MMNVVSRFSFLAALPSLLLLSGCAGEGPLSPSQDVSRSDVMGTAASQHSVVDGAAQLSGPNERACWGQATKVFAQMGEMGEHASQQPNPRVGLRNLARALFESGVIPDDSMQALGQFVASELGLRIDACM